MLSLPFCFRPSYLMTVSSWDRKIPRKIFLQSPPVPAGAREEHLQLGPGGLLPCVPHSGLCLTWICISTNCPFPQHPLMSFLHDNLIASSLPTQSPLGSVVPAAFYSQALAGGEVEKMVFNNKSTATLL